MSVRHERVNMLLVILAVFPLALCDKAVDYLSHYGYFDETAFSTDIGPAVKQFQETFKLDSTGILDNATLELMAQPRCGNKDNLLPFTAIPGRKWDSKVITWYQYGTPQYSDIIQKAFSVWEKHADITFQKDFSNPTIIISFSGQRKHMFYSRRDMCHYDFDGPGLVLAHAYHPTKQYNQTDIHFDSEENWDFSMNLTRYGNSSFFLVLVHEIGHALGLDHSYDNHSVMFPFQRDPLGLTDLNEYKLSKDDRLAIQFLYGVPTKTSTSIAASTPSTTSTTRTTTTTTTTTTTVAPIPDNLEERNICDLKHEINTYVIVNKKIYAFFREFVWILSLNPEHRTPEEYTRPKVITQWLQFLPSNFTEISAIYQKPDGNIALFTGKEVYLFRFPSLYLIAKYRINRVINRPVKNINTVLSTNQGKTYMLIDDWYLLEINECNYSGTILGSIPSVLQGVPGRVKGAFRYINGRIYFITDSSVLEYDEFVNTVTKSESNAFDVLQISCMRDSLLTKLYQIIKYIQ